MFTTIPPVILYICVALATIVLVVHIYRTINRLLTLPALAITPRASRWLSHLVGTNDYNEDNFFSADGAPDEWVEKRKRGFSELRRALTGVSDTYHQTIKDLQGSLSDLRFFDANRVPFPFARYMREQMNVGVVANQTEGPRIIDLDGNALLDVSGSYGVNVAGYERYKQWLKAGAERVEQLGPVLGPMHELVLDNTRRLKRISGQDEVSYHVSGTEAVMAAVRLARFNTRREKIVTFSGSYHGWWDGVQPGLGSERSIGDCLVLKEMNVTSLRAIRARAREVAGVMVNPVQSFNPNSPPPNDAVLLSSDVRKADGATDQYGQWLSALRQVCTECQIPLIFDEVYSGFRLAPGGAQAFYGVQADMVVYGKTLAAGLPIGVVCGRSGLMRRFDPDRPMRISYVVGTFSGYPHAMGAMHEFLKWVESAEADHLYETVARRTRLWAEQVNEDLARAGLPLKVVSLSTIFTFEFTQPSRYNWMLQYYLRASGINLSWVGTGRCLISLDFTEKDFVELRAKIKSAAVNMLQDGWWLDPTEHPNQSKHIQQRLVKDMIKSIVALPEPIRTFYAEVMRRKHDDHIASHSDRTNQFFHLISSSVFIVCYVLIFFDLSLAMWLGLGALFLRQAGHALIEPPCHDKEQLLLGFDTRSKTVIVLGFILIPVVHAVMLPSFSRQALEEMAALTAEHWLIFTVIVITGRVIRLIFQYGIRNALVWFVKLITDPFTDIKAYLPSALPSRN